MLRISSYNDDKSIPKSRDAAVSSVGTTRAVGSSLPVPAEVIGCSQNLETSGLH